MPYAEIAATFVSGWVDRKLVVAVLASMLGCSAVVGAPKSKDAPPQTYCSVVVGSKRVYKHGNAKIVETTTSIEKVSSLLIVRSETTFPSGATSVTELQVTDKGLYVVSDGQVSFSPPSLRIPVNADTTKKWEFEFDGPKDDRLKGQATFMGDETITVPAGKFKSIRVDFEYPIRPGVSKTVTRWYSLDIGMIKEAVNGDEQIVLAEILDVAKK